MMKVGDLVQYVGDSSFNDDAIGVVISKMGIGTSGWASVVWSTDKGSYHDEVPFSSLVVINESRCWI